MTALDSSVVVAALTGWHEAHDAARQAARGQAVPAHAYLESYAVLTRLPPPGRLEPHTARDLLAAWFPQGLVLQPDDHVSDLVACMAGALVSAGATYDGLVGLTAARHGHELLTLDRRAEATYQKLGVRYRLVR